MTAQTGAGEGEVTQLLMAARDGDAARLVALLDSPQDRDHFPSLADCHFGRAGGNRTLQDPNISDDSGNAALHVASECGYADLVSFLLEADADKDLINHEGSAPLHEAAFQGHLNVLQCLLAAGADKDKAAGREEKSS